MQHATNQIDISACTQALDIASGIPPAFLAKYVLEDFLKLLIYLIMNRLHYIQEDIQRFSTIKGRIEKDFKENLPYNYLVRTFCLNDNKLRHGFVHFFGQSIHDYQEKLRVDYACELMRLNPDMSILEVAYDAGYSERSTFYRAFIRLRGMPPGEWKKRNCSMTTEIKAS